LVALYDGEEVPLDGDFFVFFGGDRSFIEQAIFEGKKMLGIGLGAQVIGEVLGAPPEMSPEREYGLYPIEMVGGDELTDHFPERFRTLHWHSKMPGLPKGAEVLAISEGCPRQIIRFQEGVYGFQCHLEMTPFDVQFLVQNEYKDVDLGSYVMSRGAFNVVHCGEMNAQMWHFLSYMEQLCLEERS